jgi:hypothetical protein
VSKQFSEDELKAALDVAGAEISEIANTLEDELVGRSYACCAGALSILLAAGMSHLAEKDEAETALIAALRTYLVRMTAVAVREAMETIVQ